MSCFDVSGIFCVWEKGLKDAKVYERTLPSGAPTVHNLECISTPNNYSFLNFATLRQSESTNSLKNMYLLFMPLEIICKDNFS